MTDQTPTASTDPIQKPKPTSLAPISTQQPKPPISLAGVGGGTAPTVAPASPTSPAMAGATALSSATQNTSDPLAFAPGGTQSGASPQAPVQTNAQTLASSASVAPQAPTPAPGGGSGQSIAPQTSPLSNPLDAWGAQHAGGNRYEPFTSGQIDDNFLRSFTNLDKTITDPAERAAYGLDDPKLRAAVTQAQQEANANSEYLTTHAGSRASPGYGVGGYVENHTPGAFNGISPGQPGYQGTWNAAAEDPIASLGGSGSGSRSANGVRLTPTDPNNPLTGQTISPDNNVDRVKLAQDSLQSTIDNILNPEFQADLRDANRTSFGAGRGVSGQNRTSQGNVVSDYNRQKANLSNTLLNDATKGSIEDLYRDIGIAQQQQGFQADQQKTAFGQNLDLQRLSDSERQQLFNEALQQFYAGNIDDPVQFYQWIAGQYARSGSGGAP